MTSEPKIAPGAGGPTPVDEEGPRILSDAAKRALAEAEARRREEREKEVGPAKEVGGRGGPDPVRYGDWEKNGIVSDF